MVHVALGVTLFLGTLALAIAGPRGLARVGSTPWCSASWSNACTAIATTKLSASSRAATPPTITPSIATRRRPGTGHPRCRPIRPRTRAGQARTAEEATEALPQALARPTRELQEQAELEPPAQARLGRTRPRPRSGVSPRDLARLARRSRVDARLGPRRVGPTRGAGRVPVVSAASKAAELRGATRRTLDQPEEVYLVEKATYRAMVTNLPTGMP